MTSLRLQTRALWSPLGYKLGSHLINIVTVGHYSGGQNYRDVRFKLMLHRCLIETLTTYNVTAAKDNSTDTHTRIISNTTGWRIGSLNRVLYTRINSLLVCFHRRKVILFIVILFFFCDVFIMYVLRPICENAQFMNCAILVHGKNISFYMLHELYNDDAPN